MSTAEEIIEDALIEIGVFVPGGSLATNDLAWGAREFNRFLNSLSIDALNLNILLKENFTLVAGTGTYSIGSGGDFDTARPNSFDTVFIREDNNDYQIAVRPIKEYWELTDKTVSNRPTIMYYERSVPLGEIYFNYVPDSAYAFHFTSLKPFTTYTDVSTEVVVPIEHEEMFVTNMAVRMASRYGREISHDLRVRARVSLQAIRGTNLARTMTAVDLAGGKTYNIDEG